LAKIFLSYCSVQQHSFGSPVLNCVNTLILFETQHCNTIAEQTAVLSYTLATIISRNCTDSSYIFNLYSKYVFILSSVSCWWNYLLELAALNLRCIYSVDNCYHAGKLKNLQH